MPPAKMYHILDVQVDSGMKMVTRYLTNCHSKMRKGELISASDRFLSGIREDLNVV